MENILNDQQRSSMARKLCPDLLQLLLLIAVPPPVKEQVTCQPSLPYPGDNLDNDCDGARDEEIFDSRDDDSDGQVDEDIELVKWSGWVGGRICDRNTKTYIRERSCKTLTGLSCPRSLAYDTNVLCKGLCPNGWWDKACRKRCSALCAERVCNATTGVCKACQEGLVWQGTKCVKESSIPFFDPRSIILAIGVFLIAIATFSYRAHRSNMETSIKMIRSQADEAFASSQITSSHAEEECPAIPGQNAPVPRGIIKDRRTSSAAFIVPMSYNVDGYFDSDSEEPEETEI